MNQRNEVGKPAFAKPMVGKRGEKEAEKFLKKFGYKIIERNARNRIGEVDIVCMHKKRAVFVEVKTLMSPSAFQPEDHFSFSKQKKLRTLALLYLSDKNKGDIDYQIDLVAVELHPDLKVKEIRHYPAVVEG